MFEGRKEPLVSIITPLYNSEKYIGETIESVLNQTYKNWEMLIIDDCSKDNGVKIVNNYILKDKRIKLFRNEKNEGVSFSRNRAIDLSQGKYIAFLDSDDLWKKEKLEKQISFMEKNNIDLSYTGYEKINTDGSLRGEIKVPEKLDYKELLKNCLINCISGVYRKEKFEVFRFRKTKAEDYIFWLEIFKQIDYAYGIQESLAYYRVSNNSRSSNKLDIVKFHWKIYREYEKLNFFKAVYYYFIYIKRGMVRYKK
ncbi:glycosyltransferase family 2 protein [Fusobacterium ulcerans]|uniref:glycosyltransferase family 2 protein n=1 Tax=Fusobacterium ulcerans TaxID=861 RepID=UPI0026DB47C1|nr:glycosyltransferase family 2 protein [Fusobacterium ulcerans]